MFFRLSSKLVVILVFMTILLPGISFAFNNATRCQMLSDAISMCPEALKCYLEANFVNVHSGIHFADRHRKYKLSINPYEIESLHNSLVISLRNNNLGAYNTSHQFGVIACFIAESISPNDYGYFLPKKVVYNGFQEVNDVKKNISMLMTDYREPYRNSSAQHHRDLLYNVSVNQIVNYWTTIWRAGGQEPGTINPQGKMIAHHVFSGHIKSRRS